MTCSNCSEENPASNRFCGGCGAALERSCPGCAQTNPPGQRFCGGCGTALEEAAAQVPSSPALPATRAPVDYTPRHLADRILQSKSALEGERKQVTVLFADVKGSMELAEQLDPEDWHRLLERFFEILAEGVHRFEGTVNQYTGDGIMALFGAPISHEDHAQRACFSALHLKKALREYADELRRTRGLSFSTRIGINSGTVVVGKIGDDLRMDYTAQGMTVGLAQRMEALAEPGCAYLADDTRRLVEGYFDLRPLGEFTVKGVSDSVAVHELTGLGSQRTRLDRSRARGFSRFIGRTNELESLEHALEQSLSGRGRVVGVVADAGTGKSRLCDEFIEHCGRRDIRVIAGHCPAHGKSVAFLPVLELLRAVFGIEDRDNEQETRRKIAGELMLLDSEFQNMIPVLFEFLGVPDPDRPLSGVDSEAREKQLLAFVHHLMHARSAREAGVIFVDDLHWVDTGSEAFIAQLVEVAASTRTLVLVNFRPEYRAEWMLQSHYQQIPLDPLGAEEVQQLVSDLLGTHASLEGLGDHVYARTGGNPFFVEEIVQSLVESRTLEGQRGAYEMTGAIGDLEIPPSVHAVLAARIDRLSERDKRLLQVASVIGRQVPEPLLADVAGLVAPELADALANLQRGEFLLQHVIYPEAEYMFKHALTLDVAYESQLAEPRARLHAAVARATEARAGERLDEQAGLLAHHWESAGEAVTGARWHIRAASWAGLTRSTESMRHLRRALDLLGEVEGTPETFLLETEVLNLILGQGVRASAMDDGEQFLERAQLLARSSGDPVVRALLGHGIGSFLLFTGRSREAVEILGDAVPFAEASGDANVELATYFILGMGHWFNGSLPASRESFEAAGRVLLRAPGCGTALLGYDSDVAVPGMCGLVDACAGRCADAMSNLDRALELARDSNAATRALAYAWAAWGGALCGDRERVLARAQRAVEISEQASARNIRGVALVGLAKALSLNGQWSEVLEVMDRVVVEAPAYMHTLAGRTRALVALEGPEAGLVAAEARLATNVEQGLKVFEAEARLDIVEALTCLPTPPHDRIEQELERVGVLIEETGSEIHRPRLHEIRAQLDPAARESQLREALRLCLEMGSRDAERIRAELDR